MNNVKIEALWDTSAQISLIGKNWLNEHCTQHKIEDLSSLLDRKLDVVSAGGNPIPYEGYVTIKVLLGKTGVEMEVPFLVTKENLTQPIIGYNVIAAVSKDSDRGGENLVEWGKCFAKLSRPAVYSLMSLLRESCCTNLSSVRTVKTGTMIRAGATISIPCKIDSVMIERKTAVLFEPTLEAHVY